jgi:hypothetical protein
MTDRLRTATKLNLRPDARSALEALAIDLGCSMVQAVERLLALPHPRLVELCKTNHPAPTESAQQVRERLGWPPERDYDDNGPLDWAQYHVNNQDLRAAVLCILDHLKAPEERE